MCQQVSRSLQFFLASGAGREQPEQILICGGCANIPGAAEMIQSRVGIESLRGVWEAAPYFSDGSARTLEDVLRRTDPDAAKVHAPENASRPPSFTDGEREALLAFLRAL